jgi:hypothetical protein
MAEPLSPELILVSPPEDAALAREQLDGPPVSRWSEPPSVEAFDSVASEPVAADPSDTSSGEFHSDGRTENVEERKSVGRPVEVLGFVTVAAIGAILLYKLVLWILWLSSAASAN